MTEKSPAGQQCRIGKCRTPLTAPCLEEGTAGFLACSAAGRYPRTQPSLSLVLLRGLRLQLFMLVYVFTFRGQETGGGGGTAPGPSPCYGPVNNNNNNNHNNNNKSVMGFTVKGSIGSGGIKLIPVSDHGSIPGDDVTCCLFFARCMKSGFLLSTKNNISNFLFD